MTFGGTAELTPVDHALDALATGFDHLIKLVDDRGLEAFDDAGLVGSCRASNGCGTRCR